MRPVLLPVLLAIAACKPGEPASSSASSPSASASAAPAMSAGDAQRLVQIARELETQGPAGTRAGELLEERGEIFERSGQLEEAARAYDEAAVAYGQSPEATNMPVVRSARARERANAVRARLAR